jgi:alpha-D-xyloside xylohydrolase
MGSYRSVLNAYPLLSVEGVTQKQLNVSDRRPMVLTRSAYAGQQRTGATTWSGDVQSTWDDFRHQISAGLGFTLTGNPNFNSDIGGFFPSGYNKPGATATCSQNPLFQELYVRWLQFGLFNPMMRSHGESSRREIWEFGNPGEPVYDAIEKSIRMRYALLPYIYSTSWQVSSADDSFMRALVMDFPQDQNVWNLGSEYMFGRSLLVAPVGKALFTEETRRYSEEPVDWTVSKTYDVYLPAGTDWYDWWTGERIKGGRTVSAAAPLDRCPLYARAGAIVPLGPDDVQYCDEKPWDELVIRVYLGADGRFTLYEDEFDGQDYTFGEYTTIDFSLKGRNLSIGTRHGSYTGMLESRRFHLLVFDGKTASEQYVLYTGNPLTIKL